MVVIVVEIGAGFDSGLGCDSRCSWWQIALYLVVGEFVEVENSVVVVGVHGFDGWRFDFLMPVSW